MNLSKEIFFTLSPDLLCIANYEGYFTDLSPSWTRVLGWSVEELCAKPYMDFVHPEDRRATAREQHGLSAGQSTFSFQNRYRAQDGTYKWIEWSAQPLEGGIAAVGRDVTDRKDDSRRLIEMERRIELYQYLVETTHDPVYIISPSDNFRFYFLNEAAVRHYGNPKEKLMTMPVPEWDENYNIPGLQKFWERLKQEKMVVFETAHRVASGALIPVEVTANYLNFWDTEFIGGTIKNISERKQLQENLNQFASIASHDLQEPLRTITSYLTLLLRKFPLDEEGKEYAGFLMTATERMRALIRGILAYSRAAENVRFEKTNLNDLVKTVRLSLAEAIQESGAEILCDALPTVTGDPAQLTQLFLNLINNSIKYRSKESPKIEIRACEKANDWVISIIDNGIGIAASEQKRVFEMFHRVHSRGDYPGSGIGLATCRRIVELMHGKIWVESELGKGSKFIFTIPKEAQFSPTPLSPDGNQQRA